MFRIITADDFPPFGRLDLNFPAVVDKPADLAEVHLLTGVNGTGKTRLLSVLAAALGQSQSLTRRSKGLKATRFGFQDLPPTPQNIRNNHLESVAQLTESQFAYTSGGSVHTWAQSVPAFAYGGMAYVTDAPIMVMADVPKPDRATCLSFSRPESQSGALLQAVANLKVQAAMDLQDTSDRPSSSSQTEPSHATRLIRALEGVVTKITKRAFSFQITSYPKATLSVTWARTKLPFDALPDGLRSIIGWLVHAVVMMDALLQGKQYPLDVECVFLLDEVEAFLHPAWQRTILPAFQSLFPRSQVFAATHSPFLIASLNHGWIHQLTIAPNGKVTAEAPRAAGQGDSYVTVVEDIMGVREWYDPETEALLAEFRSKREAAYDGDTLALEGVRALASKIGSRSMELDYMMGRELNQIDRQLSKFVPSK